MSPGPCANAFRIHADLVIDPLGFRASDQEIIKEPKERR